MEVFPRKKVTYVLVLTTSFFVFLKTVPELPPTEANEFGNVRNPIRICSEQCDKRTFKALCNLCSSSKSRLNRTRIIQKKNISTKTVTNLEIYL